MLQPGPGGDLRRSGVQLASPQSVEEIAGENDAVAFSANELSLS